MIKFIKKIFHVETDEEKFCRYCQEICSKCAEKTEGCFVDYLTGKCFTKNK